MVKHVNYGLLLKRIFLFGWFLSAFVFWPWGPISYEVPKVWFIIRWIELLSVISLISIRKLKREGLDAVLLVSVVVFLIWCIISSLFGLNLSKSIWGNFYRADGLFTLLHLIIYLVILVLFSNKSWVRKFSKVISWSSGILSLVSILFWILFYGFHIEFIDLWDNAFGLTFGNPNLLVGYLIISLPMTLYLLETNRKRLFKKLYLSILIIQIVAIFLTRSWAGVLGITLFILGCLLIRFGKNKPLILLVVSATTALIVESSFISQKNMAQGNLIVAESRERIFRKGLLAFTEKPIFGWGWANFDYAFDSVDWPLKFHDDVYVDKAHSSFLEVLVTTGIVGLVIYLLIVLRTVDNYRNKKGILNKYLMFTFLLTLFHMQMNVVSISEELVFWTLAGFSVKKL